MLVLGFRLFFSYSPLVHATPFWRIKVALTSTHLSIILSYLHFLFQRYFPCFPLILAFVALFVLSLSLSLSSFSFFRPRLTSISHSFSKLLLSSLLLSKSFSFSPLFVCQKSPATAHFFTTSTKKQANVLQLKSVHCCSASGVC